MQRSTRLLRLHPRRRGHPWPRPDGGTGIAASAPSAWATPIQPRPKFRGKSSHLCLPRRQSRQEHRSAAPRTCPTRSRATSGGDPSGSALRQGSNARSPSCNGSGHALAGDLRRVRKPEHARQLPRSRWVCIRRCWASSFRSAQQLAARGAPCHAGRHELKVHLDWAVQVTMRLKRRRT